MGSTEISDADLVRRVGAAGGDAEAEAELCRRFAPRIRLYGLRHLRDDERARDLVQAVLVAVLEAARASRVEDPERFDRFVLGTARNLGLRVHRDGARAAPTDPAVLEVLAGAGAEAETSFAPDVATLLRCMAALEARARDVLLMTFHRDKSADEIAVVLSTTAGNVRVVRHRAMAALRTCMQASGEGAP